MYLDFGARDANVTDVTLWNSSNLQNIEVGEESYRIILIGV